MHNYIGQKLEGRYEIRELIGVGGMANVYKGWDTIEGRTVAVKLLRDEYADNKEFLRRFKTESKAMTVLSHPNIVKVYDVSFSDSLNIIVMEYIDGITLKEYIEQENVLSWKETVYFNIQILRALQHAHDKGIVHRDIKPHNVMLLPDGTIKVADFGIARFARSEIKTLTDRAIGSVHYISPEQARGVATDARTDIYSVGVMLFEMLTGKLPFEADSPVSVALKQIQTQPLMPTQLNPSIPHGLEEITMHAMQKDIGKRYQSAADMLRSMDEFKRDPSMSFDFETEHFGRRRKGGQSREFDAQYDEYSHGSRRTPVVAMLSGVTFAFVLATAAFIFFMVKTNNPFGTVADVLVPNMVGHSYESIRNDPAFSDFVIRLQTQDFHDIYSRGVIYDQEPKEGRRVKPGSVIQVKVSSGPRQTTLSDFSGWTALDVYTALRSLGLEYEENLIFSEVPEGCVVMTEPGSRSVVNAGSKITVYVSLGPEIKYFPVPDIFNYTIEAAREILTNAQLRVGNVSVQRSDLPAGTVLAFNPPSTSLVKAGDAIDIVVSEGPSTLLRMTVTINMPFNVNRTVTVMAALDGAVIHSERFNPNEVWYWEVTAEGRGYGDLKVYIDGRLYHQYALDFDLLTHEKLLDYGDDFY